MGEQVKELMDWARRRKILAGVFVALTLAVGILIGSVVSGRVSATKGLGFSGTTATALAVPDPVPSSSTFASIVNRESRGTSGGEHRHDASTGAQADEKAPVAAVRSGRSDAGFLRPFL